MAYVIERESRTGSRYVGIYRAADGTYKSAGTYDLRRLRDCQIIERIPHSRTYQLTADGLSTALFFTRLTRRVIIPALADLAGAGPRLAAPRQADHAYKTAIADLAAQASPGIQPPLATRRRSRQAPVVTRNPS